MKFGPTKVVVKGDALYDAKTDKLIKDGLKTRKELEDYAAHHYITLPVVDNAGKSWQLDGKPVYCLRGSKFETLDGENLERVFRGEPPLEGGTPAETPQAAPSDGAQRERPTMQPVPRLSPGAASSTS